MVIDPFKERPTARTGIIDPFSDKPQTRTTGIGEDTSEIQDLVSELEQYGQGPSDEGIINWDNLGKKSVSLLNSTLNILRTGEYAMGGILSGQSPITGIREKISPSEVLMRDREEDRKLWSSEGITGLAMDILLDPITYLTFGTTGAMKLATKGGMVPIKKAGQKLMKEVVEKGASEKVARKAMARVLEEGGEEAAKKYIGEEGLKFMGQVFMPKKYFNKLGDVIGKLPGSGAINKVGRGVAKAFIPFSDINALPSKVGGKGTYADFLYKPFERGTRDEILKEVDGISKLAAKTIKEYEDDIGATLSKTVELGEKTGDDFLDDIIKRYNRDMKEVLELEKATGKKIGKIESYMRHYLTEEGRDFLQKNPSFGGLPKPLRAQLKAAKGRKLTGTVEDINKYFKEKHGVEKFFEADLFKNWATRKAEHVKYMNTYNFLEATKHRFGKRIDKLGAKIQDGIRYVESTNPQLKGWALPEPITKHLDKTLDTLFVEDVTKGFVKHYDKLLNIWKGQVTGIWPAFHTRNFLGGSFNNWLAGVKVGDYTKTAKLLSGSDDILKTDIGTEYSLQQIKDIAERFGVVGQPGMMDTARKVSDAIEEVSMSNIKKAGIKASNAPRWAMEQVENRLRLPVFINRLEKGYSPAEAAKDVFKYHFDYVPKTGLTSFEEKWMRRIIPFYVWTRNNVPLQIEQMMKQPGKYAGLEKLRKSMFGDKEEEEFKHLPDWMKSMFVAPLPDGAEKDIGKSLWVQLDLPLEDINKLPVTSDGIRDIASMLSPFLKVPFEMYLNRDFYFGSEIYDENLPRELQREDVANQLGEKLPTPIKKFLGFKKLKYRDWSKPDEKAFKDVYTMDAKKLHLLRAFFGRYFSTLQGVLDDKIPAEWRASRFVGGIPVREIDIEKQKSWEKYSEEKRLRDIMTWLKQHKKIPYVSEEDKWQKGREEIDPFLNE